MLAVGVVAASVGGIEASERINAFELRDCSGEPPRQRIASWSTHTHAHMHAVSPALPLSLHCHHLSFMQTGPRKREF